MKLLLSLFLMMLGLCGIVSAAPVTVHTGELAGRSFDPDGLYAVWTGLPGTVPDQARIDFRVQLAKAWATKCARQVCTPVALQAKEIVLARYPARPTRMDVPRYIDRIIGQTRVDIDWTRAVSIYNLTSDETRLLQKLTRAIGGRELVAYSLTELMPSPQDGALNVAVLDYLLRSAGREYVESLPAMNDGLTSYGPYQFTAYALYDTGNERRGASVANQTLKQGRIGGSVIKLRGDGHYKAAWLFAFDSLARLVRHTDQKDKRVIANLAKRPSELTKIVACAHNKPGLCLAVAWHWVKTGAREPFTVPDDAAALYIKKTASNYAALQNLKRKSSNRPVHRTVFSFAEKYPENRSGISYVTGYVPRAHSLPCLLL